jgi:hypothetical protein
LIVLKEWLTGKDGIGKLGTYSGTTFQDSSVIFGYSVRTYGVIPGIMVMGPFYLG